MDFPDTVTRLCGMKRFSFGCHPDVACFTECCRELDLALTPYDVLCLRKELQMGSEEFIERYVVIEQDENDFPRLYLGMVDDGKASCPFISENGCRVYENRPGACRAYPVGRGITLNENGRKQELYVLVQEEHCKGFAENQSHNAAEWFENQGLTEYNAINDEVLGLLQHEQVRKGITLTQEQKDYFMLALFKLDEFRKFISSPNNTDKFNLSADEKKSVLADDLNLLRFGIHWLKEFLFTEKI
ncbi:MAG: YkgJ family cysteine cluster protein [Deltaproteobacteria bacterium]|nr:MAG: YkgJ family cysteine cluster protein [Deltaproteobacteria bacterium]